MSDLEELDKIIKSISTKPEAPQLFKVKLSPIHEEEKKTSPLRKNWDELEVTVQAVLGTKKIALKDLYNLDEGSILALNEEESEKISLYVNEKEVARGEMVALNGHFGVKITEILDK